MFDWETATRRRAELNGQAEDLRLWADPAGAQKLLRERTRLDQAIGSYQRIEREVAETLELIELAEAEGEAAMAADAEATLARLRAAAARRRLDSLLSGATD